MFHTLRRFSAEITSERSEKENCNGIKSNNLVRMVYVLIAFANQISSCIMRQTSLKAREPNFELLLGTDPHPGAGKN